MSARNCRLIKNIWNNTITPKVGFNQIKYVETNNVLYSRPICTSTSWLAKFSFNLSDIGEGIREVAVKEWYVKVGDQVKQFDNICEVQSDKASVTITSRYDGVITKLHYKIDETAYVGKPLVDIETSEDAAEEEDSSSSSSDEERSSQVDNVPIVEDKVEKSYKKDLCIPSVRRLAKEKNIDLSLIEGTGKGGRILKEDVIKYLDAKPQPVKSVQPGVETVVPIKGFKKAMVKTMTDALKIPSFGYADEISLRHLSQIRKSVNEELSKDNIKISYMPFFIKAASNALLKYPILNSSCDEKCENIIFKPNHNICVAMDTKVGLAVPVIKSVESLSIMEIHKELSRLIQSGKQGNFDPSDLIGGTFTLSNIGIIGGTYTVPVILPPQVAIVAFGATKIVPRFDSAMNIIPDEIMCASGQADHRIVDGATMAMFLSHFKKQVENPNLLFLNL